jgi:hypothetical protein
MSSENELFAKLDQWLKNQSTEPNIFDVVKANDIDLFAAFVLRHFRAAAKNAVADRLSLEAGKVRAATWERAGAIGTLIDWLSETWNLSSAEQVALLGLKNVGEIVAIRGQAPRDASQLLLEHLAMLIDIYQALSTLLPGREDGEGWLRRSNDDGLFRGTSPIAVMLDRGRPGIKDVRAYLWAQIW